MEVVFDLNFIVIVRRKGRPSVAARLGKAEEQCVLFVIFVSVDKRMCIECYLQFLSAGKSKG